MPGTTVGDREDTLAAIDVGTNSVHLVVARVTGEDRFEVISSEKEMVRLGTGSGDMKLLTPEAMQRGVDTLRRMKLIADIDGAPVRAVATSAVREAENHDEFVALAREGAGVEVEVISGVEEARLIHLGVLQAVPVFDRRLLLCDIGGGSTEVLVGERGEVLTARSFKLGAVRLTNRFFPGERLHPSAVSSCRAFVRSTLSPFSREVAAHGFEVAVGSSGTIQAVAAMAQAATGAEPPRSFNRFRLSADDVRAVVKALIGAPSIKQRSRLPGLDANRADIVLAGALILEGVVETFGVEELEISDYALREGVLLDTIQRTRGGSLHHLRDVSRRSVLHLAELCDEDPEHSAHVARLALELFDGLTALPSPGLKGLDGLGEPAREYLEAGALLANVGLFISHSRHHLHSYYVVRNSEVLTGLTDDEIEIIALLARYHRKSGPKPGHPEFARLSDGDQQLVRALAGILRIAIGLDRSHSHRVGGTRCRLDGETVVIELVPADGAEVELEQFAADQRRDLLEEVLGQPIALRVATSPDQPNRPDRPDRPVEASRGDQ
jgi:exopolyphosphatase/guanosine-5'-triphosphate,3'-diphosphate pyrophosphatase